MFFLSEWSCPRSPAAHTVAADISESTWLLAHLYLLRRIMPVRYSGGESDSTRDCWTKWQIMDDDWDRETVLTRKVLAALSARIWIKWVLFLFSTLTTQVKEIISN